MKFIPLRPKPVLSYPISSKQVMLDYVAHHFLVEKNPFGVFRIPEAGGTVNNCVYDTPSGGCAIGCLLPAETRTEVGRLNFGFPGHVPVADLPSFLPLERRIIETFAHEVHKFASHLQAEHDNAANSEDYVGLFEGLGSLATRYELEQPVRFESD